jgi:D-alanyl-D-alanine carboxypeptidase
MQRPTASLLKIMTAATADKILAMSPKLADKKLTIINMKNESAVDFALPTGSTWLPDPLMQIMLLGSSNKAAETIASQLVPRTSFMSLMNFYAKQMGLTQTYFRNASGLTEGPTTAATKATASGSTIGDLSVAGGVSTPREFAKMMWNIISAHPGLLDITGQGSITITSPKTAANPKGLTVVSNTNKILSNFPIIFGKTGFTENAGGNLAIVMQKSSTSQPYIIVVLDSDDTDSRFADAAKLASTTLQLMDLQDLRK